MNGVRSATLSNFASSADVALNPPTVGPATTTRPQESALARAAVHRCTRAPARSIAGVDGRHSLRARRVPLLGTSMGAWACTGRRLSVPTPAAI
ncbi:unnamed protein product [Tuber aestivum]|uniref:Uncharacterized protein n=1 Tax=Tuber aestivum TaxID=59557 RepID=A0A292PW45_9PEZI|nr:unnamed protein product [Tuber aestivum]